MDIFDNRYYRINRLLMGAMGQWPYQPLVQRRVQCFFLYLSIGTVTLVQGIKLVERWGDIDIMVECMVPMGVQVVAFMKSSNCITNGVKMKRLLDLMRKDWAALTDEGEIRILMGYARTGFMRGAFYGGETTRQILILFLTLAIETVSVYASMTIYLILPLMPQILDVILPLNVTRPRQFLYQTEYYVDQDEYYATIMIHNYWGTLLTITVVVSVDTMLLAYVHHICGIFTIIGLRLENTMKDSKVDVSLDWKAESEKIYSDIANCIKDHGEVMGFARLVETAFSTSFFFQMGTSMLMISATGLQVVTNLGSYHEAFRLGQFIIGQLVHLFVNSWPSQMLMDHTQQFRDSVYFAEWYRFPLRGRHLLRLAMLRSLKPCKMTAGKLYDMSMESFAKVVQTSMSYFTVLVSLR